MFAITTTLFTDDFVESAGAVVFNLAVKQICILHIAKTDEYLLPKGRRNCTEPRSQAALREVKEETGYSCTLLPITMLTRQPPMNELGNTRHEVRIMTNVTEPFAFQKRTLKDGTEKIIWWFIAQVTDSEPEQSKYDSTRFLRVWLGYDDAVNKLTFPDDQKLVSQAIHLVTNTYSQ